MGMRIVWGLHDREQGGMLLALFEAENLLTQYRDNVLMRPWYDAITAPLGDFIPTGDDEADAQAHSLYLEQKEAIDNLLNIGYDRWRIDELNSSESRWYTKRYELWNSVPPNRDRLVIQFQAS